jgi:hypothetical protein
MFYLIGKGRAIKDAVADGGLQGSFVGDIARARRPVFARGTIAMALTMAAAIVGGGVDTKVLPPIVHAGLAFAALASNLWAFKAELAALGSSARITDEINRLLGA